MRIDYYSFVVFKNPVSLFFFTLVQILVLRSLLKKDFKLVQKEFDKILQAIEIAKDEKILTC